MIGIFPVIGNVQNIRIVPNDQDYPVLRKVRNVQTRNIVNNSEYSKCLGIV